MARLADAKRQGNLEAELRRLSYVSLLVVDEVGYIPFDPEAANLMFSLVSARYERASMIVTSNKPFSAWGEIFGDEVTATAMIDRLVHHAEILSLNFQPAQRGQLSTGLDTRREGDSPESRIAERFRVARWAARHTGKRVVSGCRPFAKGLDSPLPAGLDCHGGDIRCHTGREEPAFWPRARGGEGHARFGGMAARTIAEAAAPCTRCVS